VSPSGFLSLAVLALAALVVVTGACGDEPVAQSSSTTTPAESTSTTAAPTTTTTAKGLTAQSPLRMDGIGPVTMGMTPAEASAAVGRPVKIDDSYSTPEDPALCAYAYTPLEEGGTAKVGFMLERTSAKEDWRIVRTDIDEGLPTATEKGVKLGATEAEVKAAYPALTVSPHPYTGPEGHYMTVDPDGQGGWLLIFETDGTKVESFRSGQEGPVQYIEGCS
jgi:hypothetical protein